MSDLARTRDLTFLDGASNADIHRRNLVDQGDSYWTVNNSSVDDYSRRANIFGHPDRLKAIISEQIGFDDANVGLDIAAGTSARALRDLLESGVLGLALATNYADNRPSHVAEDERLDHIDGDLTEAMTWGEIVDWKERKAPHGLALAMHRPVGGLQHLPYETYQGAAHLVLDMVRPGGLMFTQVPRDVVFEPRDLSVLCQSIRKRSDVSKVITNVPRKSLNRDENDLYAVILKK